MTWTDVRGRTVEQRAAKRQAYRDRAVQKADRSERSLVCAEGRHRRCAGEGVTERGERLGAGCLCPCHEPSDKKEETL